VHARATDPLHFGIKAGYTHQQQSYLETGVLVYGDEVRSILDIPSGFFAGYLGWDFSLGASKFNSGPSLGFETHYGIVCGRVHSTLLTDFRQSSLQASLEGGLTFLGWAYVMAGYNISLTGKTYLDITGFKISAGINLYDFHEWGD